MIISERLLVVFEASHRKQRPARSEENVFAMLVSAVSRIRWSWGVVTCLMLVPVLGVAMLASASSAEAEERFPVRVLVITMFAAETSPWLEHESLPVTMNVPYLGSPLRCAPDGLCVATIGEGKSNAVASMSALLDAPKLDFSKAYFLTVGIAGTSPASGTLGFAAWARWIVDWDLGYRYQPAGVPGTLHGYLPYPDQHTNVFRLNDGLVDKAFELTKGVALSDSSKAVRNRRHYPGQAGRKPFTTICDTVSGDAYWNGSNYSRTAQYITDAWTNGAGRYCTTEMEDSGTASALARHGYLDRYLDLRAASDFDRPYVGQSTKEALMLFAGVDPAIKNSYLVGSTVAHYLIAHSGFNIPDN